MTARSNRSPLAALFGWLLALFGCAPLAAAPASDAAVKVAIVYNIGKFVDWPADALRSGNPRFTLCLTGSGDELRSATAQVDGKPVQGRTLQIRAITSTTELKGCQILYLPDADAESLGPWLSAAHALSVLTVGDAEHFADAGGDVALTTQDNRVRFEINLGAVQSANLSIRSELLRLASRVIGATHP